MILKCPSAECNAEDPANGESAPPNPLIIISRLNTHTHTHTHTHGARQSSNDLNKNQTVVVQNGTSVTGKTIPNLTGVFGTHLALV